MGDRTERTGADLLVACLENAGVTVVFGVPGEETTALMVALDASTIDFVLCRHEQGAAFMASVHARLTRTPGVCLSTLGPGATNLVTGVADAQLDHVPLIAITGQGARRRLGRLSHQMIDLEALFQPVTKFSRTLLSADDIPASFSEAVRQSRSGRPGAVHLCLPEDVADMRTDAQVLPNREVSVGRAELGALAKAADAIAAAQNPIIVAGAGVFRDDAVEPLQRFAEATAIPVATTFMASGLLPPEHPQTLYTVGQGEDDWIDLALAASDLIVLVGFDAVEYPPTKLLGSDHTRVCVIDSEPPRADTGLSIAVEVIGGLAHTLSDLRIRLEGRVWQEHSATQEARAGMQSALSAQITEVDAGAVAPPDICRVISDGLAPEDTVLSGVGAHKLWVARHVLPQAPGQLIVPNGLAGMGLALPGALAAARLNPDGHVLAVCGDGDVMMNVQEMESITRLGLRLTVLVWVDGGLGLIDAHQGTGGPDFPFGNPVWASLATAFGWSYAHVERLDMLAEALSASRSAEGATLLTIPVDYQAVGHVPRRLSEFSRNRDVA
ncbi:acetolactate synthase large subunit [Cognatishimia sp. F0-27]|uniref:acetolactate synthase large subunit n=1 Tax=Cognatishimia sp. F0-27 TaxID=2816855 RepID=UPI001D0C0289|nr:acetolactate synthase large subunit [Cognatishimia sp. F0-27]MCC1493872.1 acetolactate synthase large subunit [Cognatishimia sp. F0-27]